MESCKQTQSNDRVWPYLLGAVFGTLLMAAVACGTGDHGAYTASEELGLILLRAIAVVLLLLIVPALWARLAHRISPWVLLGLAAFTFTCGLLLSGDAMTALYAVLLIALPGAGLFGLQKLRLSNFRTVLYESFIVLAALFGFLCLNDMVKFGDAYRPFKHVIGLYGTILEEWNALLGELGGTQISTAAAELISEVRKSPEALFVPMLMTVAMTAGLSVTLFSHLFNRRGDAELTTLPPFSEWRCERWYVYLAAGFLLVTMLLGAMGVQGGDALSGVAGVLWRMPCTLAGLCTVRSIGLRLKKGWIFWIAIAMLVTLPMFAWMALAVIGMMSALRRPSNAGEDGIRK